MEFLQALNTMRRLEGLSSSENAWIYGLIFFTRKLFQKRKVAPFFIEQEEIACIYQIFLSKMLLQEEYHDLTQIFFK